jgi:hypothetical protein
LEHEHQESDVSKHRDTHLRTEHGQNDSALFSQRHDALPVVSIISKSRKKETISKFNDWLAELMAVSKQKDVHDHWQANGVQKNLARPEHKCKKKVAILEAWLLELEDNSKKEEGE